MDKAYAMFQVRLGQMQQAITNGIIEVENTLIGDDLNTKMQKASDLMGQCKNLMDFCGDQVPSWAIQIYNSTHQFMSNSQDFKNRKQISDLLMTIKNEVAMHDWSLGGYDSNLNFEQIYTRYKAESKLSELFTELIRLIEKIISENVIGQDQLEKNFKFLLSIVRSNTNKSYFGDMSVISFVMYFIKEFLLNLASNIPGLKEGLTALIDTAKKLKTEMDETKQKTDQEIERVAKVKSLVLYSDDGSLKQIDELYGKKLNLLS
jgi:hypothetical protein